MRIALLVGTAMLAATGAAATQPVDLTPEMQSAVEEAVKKELIDPESARFEHFHAHWKDDKVLIACGLVNARNRMGGYSGNANYRADVFHAKKGDGTPVYVGLGAIIERDAKIFYSVVNDCR